MNSFLDIHPYLLSLILLIISIVNLINLLFTSSVKHKVQLLEDEVDTLKETLLFSNERDFVESAAIDIFASRVANMTNYKTDEGVYEQAVEDAEKLLYTLKRKYLRDEPLF